MTQTENFIQRAIEAGQLIYEDDLLDDDPNSDTEGMFFALFKATEPKDI